MYAIQKYEPTMDKIMRMHSVTSTIENGFVHLPDKAAWLGEYLHELTSFPKCKWDDQADSTSQGLEWLKQQAMGYQHGLIELWRQEAEKLKAGGRANPPSFSRGQFVNTWSPGGFFRRF